MVSVAALRSAILLAMVSLAFAVPVRADASARIPGIDISEYQKTIDWDKVGNSDVRFIIMRATKGLDYTDAKYVTNSAGAIAQGIKWTAYHYAVPGGKKGDAVAQADFFVETADLKPGNILPVLDMESTGGLGKARLEDWTARWLNRVYHRTGAKGIIYSSPAFWRSYLGDSTRFASHGYKLWVANWFVKKPDVPARNWSGHGWTFWQWTDCGSVSGISGCVDKDRYNGTHIGRLVTMH